MAAPTRAAIALTLLVLPLMESVTAVQESHVRMHVGDWLSGHSDAIAGFLMSFGLVAAYWAMHHQATRHVLAFRGRMLAANVLWLLGIVLLPVLSGIIIAFADDAMQKALYTGDLALIAGSMLWYEAEIRRHPGAAPASADEELAGHMATSGAMIVAAAVSFVLAAFTPLGWLGMFAMGLVGLLRRPLGRLTSARTAR